MYGRKGVPREKALLPSIRYYSARQPLRSDNNLLFLIKCRQRRPWSPLVGGQWERPMHLSADHSHRTGVITHGSAPQSNQRGAALIRGDSLTHTPTHKHTHVQHTGRDRSALSSGCGPAAAKLWQIIASGRTFLHSVQCCLKPSGWNI